MRRDERDSRVTADENQRIMKRIILGQMRSQVASSVEDCRIGDLLHSAGAFMARYYRFQRRYTHRFFQPSEIRHAAFD